MSENEEESRDPLLKSEEEAAAREAAGIGGSRPEYEDEEGREVSESDRALIEGGEGVEEGFDVAEEDLVEAASHGENRYDPSAADFGDDESAGDADVVDAEADEVDVPDGPDDPDDEQ